MKTLESAGGELDRKLDRSRSREPSASKSSSENSLARLDRLSGESGVAVFARLECPSESDAAADGLDAVRMTEGSSEDPVLDSSAMELVSLLLLALAAAAQSGTPAVEPGFTSLFNGKDLTGWRIGGPTESFAVRDGAIVASGPASHAYYDGPFRNHRFRNFELRIDILAQAGANGGVYVLTEFEQVGGTERASGRFPSKGFEVQVYNSTGGPRTGSLYHVVDILDHSPAKDDEWFTQTIIVKGDTIVVKVNDKQLVNWTQPADWDGGPGPGRRITGQKRSLFRLTMRRAPCSTRTSE
jgi:hypothetical protein